MDRLLLIAGSDSPEIADFAAFLQRGEARRLAVVSTPDICQAVGDRAASYPVEGFSTTSFLSAHDRQAVASLVVFLSRRWSEDERKLVDAVAEIAHQNRATCVCLVSTFLVHFGDRSAARAEAYAVDRFKQLGCTPVVIRPSRVLSDHSRARGNLRRLAFLSPLVPSRFTNCFVGGDELFAVLERETAGSLRPRRTLTLLGPNRPWKEVLRAHRGTSLWQRAAVAIATVVSLLGVGQVLGALFSCLARIVPRLRSWSFDTLRPDSVRELLALYNRHNYRHVKVVGYNNGVIHFGQRYPGKTLVSTVGCNRVARVHDGTAKFDGGVTIRQAVDVLDKAGKELYVLPNYSYVSLGTSFFVPIHGSASECSTVGDTIEKVALYDPVEDRMVVARRGKAAFKRYIYNLDRDVLLLRLYLRVKDKSRYYMVRQTLADPRSQELLSEFHDSGPSNVEIRKAKAAGRSADVYKYYTRSSPLDAGAQDFPRDAVGRLWDRIEANPIAATLFHGLMRRFGYHVEMFLSAAEFATFWETHGRLPIAKIQLRYIKRDGFPHSPFREHDCVSADLFMLRRHRRVFEQYVRDTFREVQFNPGKHSM